MSAPIDAQRAKVCAHFRNGGPCRYRHQPIARFGEEGSFHRESVSVCMTWLELSHNDWRDGMYRYPSSNSQTKKKARKTIAKGKTSDKFDKASSQQSLTDEKKHPPPPKTEEVPSPNPRHKKKQKANRTPKKVCQSSGMCIRVYITADGMSVEDSKVYYGRNPKPKPCRYILTLQLVCRPQPSRCKWVLGSRR